MPRKKNDKPWKVRRWINSAGYAVVRDPEVLNCPLGWKDGRIYEHHLVIWKAGIPFDPRTQDVHHKDRDPLNNALSNLEVVDMIEHARMDPQVKNLRRYKAITCTVGLGSPRGTP